MEKNNKKENRVYLDFASQTLPSKKVLAEMKKVSAFNFNPANLYKEGLVAENILKEARKRIAKILGVKDYEIYFTNSGTFSISAAIFGVVNSYKEENKKENKNNKNYLKPHIITSNIEHSAVLENVKYLEKIGDIEATYIEADEFGLIAPEKVKKAIKENTVLVSIMYVNNEIGTIQDIKNISKKIKEWKKERNQNSENLENYFSPQTPQAKVEKNNFPYFHTDAAQAGNYLSLYIDMLGVDMLSLNGSKIYGPKSSGILFKKESVKISPFYFGGKQERDIFSGTQDIEKAVGLSFALLEAEKNIKDKNLLEKIAEKRNTLLKNIFKYIPEAEINGAWNENEWKKEKIGVSREERTANRLPNNISLWLPDFVSDELVLRLDSKGFAVSTGAACGAKEDEYSHVIYALTNSKKRAKETIRITIDKNTDEKDLLKFVKTLKEIYFKYKKI